VEKISGIAKKHISTSATCLYPGSSENGLEDQSWWKRKKESQERKGGFKNGVGYLAMFSLGRESIQGITRHRDTPSEPSKGGGKKRRFAKKGSD